MNIIHHTRGSQRAFSLIELLVALSILAVVAAIIVPRFLNVRSSAAQSVTKSQRDSVNNACQQWISLGGNVLGTPTAADWLTMLSTTSGGTRTFGASANALSDSQGTIGSATIALSGITPINTTVGAMGDTAATIAALNQGFHYALSTNGTSGGAASYSDGAGSEYVVTITPAGVVTFTHTTNSSDTTNY